MLRYSVLFAAAALAAFSQTNSNLTDRERMSEIGSRVVEKTAQAHAAVDQKDKDLAEQRVREALQNIAAIEAAHPRANPELVTLYTEMIQFSVDEPAVAATGHTGSANRMAPAGTKAVADSEGEATRVTLNATQAKAHLQAAEQALERSDFGAATAALGAVDKDVTAETVVADLPLLKARQNFAAALGAVREQRYNDAVAPLKAASEALQEYAGSKSPHAADAGALKTQVDAMASSIGKEHAGAEEKLGKWWNQASDWFTPLQPPK